MIMETPEIAKSKSDLQRDPILMIKTSPLNHSPDYFLTPTRSNLSKEGSPSMKYITPGGNYFNPETPTMFHSPSMLNNVFSPTFWISSPERNVSPFSKGITHTTPIPIHMNYRALEHNSHIPEEFREGFSESLIDPSNKESRNFTKDVPPPPKMSGGIGIVAVGESILNSDLDERQESRENEILYNYSSGEHQFFPDILANGEECLRKHYPTRYFNEENLTSIGSAFAHNESQEREDNSLKTFSTSMETVFTSPSNQQGSEPHEFRSDGLISAPFHMNVAIEEAPSLNHIKKKRFEWKHVCIHLILHFRC